MADCSEFVCVDDFEKYALRSLSKITVDYYRSGANNEQTLKENRRAFYRLRIRPRCLRDVSHRDLRTQILGQPISFPVGVAPSAMQKMAHPDGEIANVKATSAAGTVMILSTISTTSVEDVAKAAPSGLKWFQLYIYRDREITKQLVERAEKNGYKALVLTVDTPLFGHRLADSRNKFSLPPHLRLANFNAGDPKFSGMSRTTKGSSLAAYSSDLFDPSLSWKDIHWLRTITTLPIVAKGILTAEDATLAVQNGVDAVLVSNHGARQLDGVPATIEALPEIVRAVGGRCEVYLDGGVRTGTDVLKALALGAKMVFVGRPILWGLAHSGQQGASRVLEILRDELDVAMGLAGFEVSSAAMGKCKLKSDWLQRKDNSGHVINDWGQRKSDTLLYCRLCKSAISVERQGFYAILQHAQSKTHKSISVEVLGKQQVHVRFTCEDKSSGVVNELSTSSIAPSRQATIWMYSVKDSATVAEIIWTLKAVQLNFSFSSCDGLPDLFRFMFPCEIG